MKRKKIYSKHYDLLTPPSREDEQQIGDVLGALCRTSGDKAYRRCIGFAMQAARFSLDYGFSVDIWQYGCCVDLSYHFPSPCFFGDATRELGVLMKRCSAATFALGPDAASGLYLHLTYDDRRAHPPAEESY